MKKSSKLINMIAKVMVNQSTLCKSSIKRGNNNKLYNLFFSFYLQCFWQQHKIWKVQWYTKKLEFSPWRVVPHSPHLYKSHPAGSSRSSRHLGHLTTRSLGAKSPDISRAKYVINSRPKVGSRPQISQRCTSQRSNFQHRLHTNNK